MGGRLLYHRTNLPAKAYGAEPLSIDEIDAHPDSARIWATVKALREEVSQARDSDFPAWSLAGFR